jgi:hypothetical protein
VTSDLMVEGLERDRRHAPSILTKQPAPPLVTIARRPHLDRSSTSRRNLLLQRPNIDLILLVLEWLIPFLLVSILRILLAPLIVILAARQRALRPTRAQYIPHYRSSPCQSLDDPSEHSARRVALGGIERRLGRVNELDDRSIGSRGGELAALRLTLLGRLLNDFRLLRDGRRRDWRQRDSGRAQRLGDAQWAGVACPESGVGKRKVGNGAAESAADGSRAAEVRTCWAAR